MQDDIEDITSSRGAIELITLMAESCINGNSDFDEYKRLERQLCRSGALEAVSPVRAAEVLRNHPRGVQDMVLEAFSDEAADDIYLIMKAANEHAGLKVAKAALEQQEVPEFINFVAGFPEDFLTVYVALRDNCERTMHMLMDDLRGIGFEFTHSNGKWDCYRHSARMNNFMHIMSVVGDKYVHTGILTMVAARLWELESALKDLEWPGISGGANG